MADSDLKRLAPSKWWREFEQAFEKQLPTQGSVRDRHGVTHEILGDFTVCDEQWASFHVGIKGPRICRGWACVVEPVTCFKCLGDR